MLKQIGILGSVLFLTACAKMPPVWWNPRPLTGNTQHPVGQTQPKVTRPVRTPEELELSLQDETYEEMTITPLQDEEAENDSGDESAQSVVPPEDELPAPSVLEE